MNSGASLLSVNHKFMIHSHVFGRRRVTANLDGSRERKVMRRDALALSAREKKKTKVARGRRLTRRRRGGRVQNVFTPPALF